MLMDQQNQQQQQQQQGFKHYCRICKKGFGCGRALGGHMRAHGINDVDLTDDDDPSASGEYCPDDDKPPGPRRMYALRTNPNCFKSCRSCENCGKEFLSWKSFIDHGKRSSDDESPPSSDGGEDLGCAGWSKGKRSRRTKAVAAVTGNASAEEEELANCLVMLSAARVEPAVAAVETEESCASASKAVAASAFAEERAKAPAGPYVPRGMFECKACKKVFSSHQALGGHRASHKKVKGCFAAKLGDEGLDARGPTLPDEDPVTDVEAAEMAVAMSMAIVPFENSPLSVAPLKKKNAKVHECSICRRVFASGQALGGHKRCHWITSNAPDPMASSKLHGSHLTLRPIFDPPSDAGPLDLNLPATPADGLTALRQSDIGSPLRLEVPPVYLQPWIDQANNPNKKNKMAATSGCSNIRNNNSVNPNCSINNNETSVDGEADSKVKLAKLSDLKDLKDGGEASSPWLQVGIGTSPTNECGCDP